MSRTMFKKKDEIFRRELAGHKHCRGLSVETGIAQRQVMRKTAVCAKRRRYGKRRHVIRAGLFGHLQTEDLPENVIYILAARIAP